MDLKEITHQVVILVEGHDEVLFLPHLCKARGLTQDVQFIEYGGKNKLELNLRTITKIPGFNSVTSIGLIRDADSDRTAAVQSIRHAMQMAALKSATTELTLHNGSPKTAFFVAPANLTGEFEDCLLQSVATHAAIPCIDAFVTAAETQCGHVITKKSKAKVQSFLAVQGAEPITHISVGAKAKIWPMDHAAFDGYAELIRLVTS